MTLNISPLPFSRRGRLLLSLIFLLLASIWAVGLHAWSVLPARVPLHFNAAGEPDSFGGKSAFLLLPVAFSAAPVIFLLMIRYRFTLVNRFPYLISLPAFFTVSARLTRERRGFWLNLYFELVAALGVMMTAYLLALLLGISQGAMTGHMPSWFTTAALAGPVPLIALFLVALASMSRRMQEEAASENRS